MRPVCRTCIAEVVAPAPTPSAECVAATKCGMRASKSTLIVRAKSGAKNKVPGVSQTSDSRNWVVLKLAGDQ